MILPANNSLSETALDGIAEVARQKLPLEKTLPLLLADLPRGRTGRAWKNLLRRLAAGESLPSVVADSGRNAQLAALIEGGLNSNSLPEVLQQSLEDERAFRRLDQHFRGILLYSLLITTLAIYLATQILVAMVPLSVDILKEIANFGTVANVPGFSAVRLENLIYIQIAALRIRWWLILAPSILVGSIWLLSWVVPLGAASRYLPLIGPAYYWREYTRCARLLELYLRAGLTYPLALQYAGRGTRGLVARLSCNNLAQRISEGLPLEEAVNHAGSMPDSLLEILAQVTRQPHLGRMLRTLSDLYEQRSRESLRCFLLIWEPAVMLSILAILGLSFLTILPVIKLLGELT